MKTIISRAVCALFVVSLCGCYTVNVRNSSGQPPAQLGPSTSPSLGHFVESRHAHFLVLGLINVGTPSVSEVLTDMVREKGGTSVSNLQITTTHTFVDGVINLLTAGIYNPVTVEFQGDVIK